MKQKCPKFLDPDFRSQISFDSISKQIFGQYNSISFLWSSSIIFSQISLLLSFYFLLSFWPLKKSLKSEKTLAFKKYRGWRKKFWNNLTQGYSWLVYLPFPLLNNFCYVFMWKISRKFQKKFNPFQLFLGSFESNF